MTLLDEILNNALSPMNHPPNCKCKKCRPTHMYSRHCNCMRCQKRHLSEDITGPDIKIVKRKRLLKAAGRSGISKVRKAIATGIRDEVQLTNMIFNSRHPYLPKSQFRKKGQKRWVKDWLNIRNKIVRPLLLTARKKSSRFSKRSPQPGVIRPLGTKDQS